MLVVFLTRASLPAVDKYKVVKVIGSIILKKTGAQLAGGDEILSTDPIIFKTANAKASVISSQIGRFILTAGNMENNTANVKSNLLPPMSNISSRAGAMLNAADIKSHFNGNYLLLRQINILVGRESFPMNDSSFFYLSYNHNSEAINKKLKYRADTLLILEKELFMVDGKSISYPESTGVKMNYQQGKKRIALAEFSIVTPNNDQLVKEVKIIIDESPTKGYKELLPDILSYLNEFYGKTDEDNVKHWLKENFNLSK
jgi:hypothetical protein